MNQFMAPHDNFNFQPMQRELNQMAQFPPKIGMQNSKWSAEFKPDVSSASLRSNGSAWSSEFRSASPSSITANTQRMSPSVQQQHLSTPMMNSRIGGYQPMFQNYAGSGLQSAIRPSQANSKMAELGNQEQWESQFQEIDEQLTKQQGKQAEEQTVEEAQAKEAEPEIVIDDKYQANFDEVWDAIHQHDDDFIGQEPSWEKDFATYAQNRVNFGQYNFEQTNQFRHAPNAYEIGLTLMENGAKLSEAALAFEAAVQENPEHIDAWLKLGEVQTQNEKEIAGLTALEKCLSLDPKNLNALMTLAVSYINEGYDNAAFATLERWIETKYPQISERARTTNPKINDEDRYSLHKRVTELFLQAAQLSPTGANIDADVQMGLGVLFYANDDFDKTIDCFKAALAVRPNDALLWNRLGASLANSSRSEEAIEAYHRALQLKPSFVRARYNLGVSSINIGCYKEAAEHLLGALSMHNVEGLDPSDLKNYTSVANQSTSIMETLKRAFIAMDRRDLLEKIRPGMDLNQFRGEFTF
jgi:peroxin-5